MPVLVPPIAPMLARLARALPEPGAGDVVFEPKWDGFRCLAFVHRGEVDLRSRNDRPLARYFPEVVEALADLTDDAVLDGELVACRDGQPDFPALLARLHPAETRVRRLAVETPATLLAFDLLATGDEDLREAPFASRRRRLEQLVGIAPHGVVQLSDVTGDRERAFGWLHAGPRAGIDGVVVKELGDPYVPGGRVMVKVKLDRTADCVVAGFRWRGDNDGVSSLLLGLHDDEGVLHHVGATGSMGKHVRREVTATLAPLVRDDLTGHPWEHGFALEGGPQGRLKGSAGRWTPDQPRDWFAVDPVLVCEVGYDQLDGHRFRHPARFRHWRPDRDAASCHLGQLA